MLKTPRNIATTDDLFAVCADRYGYSEPVARVVANVLFWSQFAENYFRGHLGIFKTNAELAKDIRKHHTTVGRLLMEVCAPAESGDPNAVFLTRYGPKPWAKTGRVRWLFRTALGDEIIATAIRLAETRPRRKAREQSAVTARRKTLPFALAPCCDQSLQNAVTPIIQTHSSESRFKSLSLGHEQKEIPNPSNEERLQEQVTRLVGLWERACTGCGQATLIWLPSDVQRWSVKLTELIQILRLGELSDDDILMRLRLLAGDLNSFGHAMGSRFMEYNRHGLMIESFARFGQKLWRAAEAELAEEQRIKKKSIVAIYASKEPPVETS